MKPAFVKKNTEGGAAGFTWEAGEVKALNPYLANELVKLAPGDYEIVVEGEFPTAPPVHNSPEVVIPSLSTDGTGIEAHHPASTIVEVVVEDTEPLSEPAETPQPTKAKGATKKSIKTETPSAE